MSVSPRSPHPVCQHHTFACGPTLVHHRQLGKKMKKMAWALQTLLGSALQHAAHINAAHDEGTGCISPPLPKPACASACESARASSRQAAAMHLVGFTMPCKRLKDVRTVL